ncbi:MAG: ABC transporter permease [Mycobacterium leprae]
MGRVLLKRVLRTIVVIFGALTVVFLLLHLAGDPARMLVPENATAEDIAMVHKFLGLDQPLYQQWGRFVLHAMAGNFGTSFYQQRPAMAVVTERLPATLELAAVAMLLNMLVALPVGILSAVKRGSFLDRAVTATAMLGRSMPVFWLGLMGMLLFAVKLHLLPVSGRQDWRSVIMPSVTLAVFMAPVLVRLVRSTMLDILREEFVRTARGKGLSERRVIYRHALRNAALPLVTITGLQLGSLVGGTAITEAVFAWPGLGQQLVQSVTNLDYPVVQAATAVIAVAIALVNLTVDLLYGYLDPRVRVDG